MQKRNFLSKCIVIALITCFLLLFQPLTKNQLIQSPAWAGNSGWSDAFGTPSGKSSTSSGKPATSGGGWNTVIDDDRYNPVVYENKKTKKGHPRNHKTKLKSKLRMLKSLPQPNLKS